MSAIAELPDGRAVIAMRSGAIDTLELTEGATPKPLAEGFQRPAALAVRGDALYVSDIGTHQLVKVNLADGTKTIVAPDVHLGLALAMLPSGNLLVLERGLKRIVEIDAGSGATTEVATHLPIGWLPETSAPLNVGLTVDKNGAIYFSSDIDNSIYRLVKR
jgi:glucose/arabinose dehydrogenase